MGEGQLKILEMLFTWRDYVARVEDESIKYVMPTSVMFDIAKSTPRKYAELDIVLKRHPRHNHHTSILKFEKDLIERINIIIEQHSKILEKRIKEENKNIKRYDESSSSSSSDNQLEEAKVKIDDKKSITTFKNKENSNFKVEACPIEYTSKVVFPKNTETENQQNSSMKGFLGTKISLSNLIGYNPPKSEKSSKMLQKSNKDIIVQEPSTSENIVERVEEIKIEPQKSQKTEKIDKSALPEPISKKYKTKRGRRGNVIRDKTENQNDDQFEVNQNSLMTKATNVTKQSKEDYSNEAQVVQKTSLSQKRRDKKKKLQDNLQGFQDYQEPENPERSDKVRPNPKTWNAKLQAAEKVVGKQIDKLYCQSKGAFQKRAYDKTNKPKDAQKPNNRFEFLEDDSNSD